MGANELVNVSAKILLGRHQPVYEEIPMVLQRRNTNGGFEVMSKSQSGTGHGTGPGLR
jgi:hypothetical protein